MKLKSHLFFLFALLASVTGQAAVYHDVPVGKYKKEASFTLKDCENKTFLSFMIDKIYPALKKEAKNQNMRGQHIEGVKNGEGVQIRLTDDVSTYHVKYKAAGEERAERSGRSFGAVGSNPNKPSYLADASDSYYLSSLEKLAKSETQLRNYYEAIFGVLTKCDASGFAKLDTEGKQVAGDFVAVYVAEEYRHLVGGDGKLGSSFNWDDALLQVTMIASFHAGQKPSESGMFYEGKFTDKVYNQKYEVKVEGKKDPEEYCLYKQPENPKRKEFKQRHNQLNDYWQFNADCSRSGINLTRSDFTKMGQAITKWAAENDKEDIKDLIQQIGSSGTKENFYGAVAKYYINNKTPSDLSAQSRELIKSIVDILMDVRKHAPEITDSL